MKAISMGAVKATRQVSSYNSFVGVDFSTDPMLVDKNHSPYALNLVSDDGGMPEKRPGWRTLMQLEGKINGLFYCMIDGQEHYLCHAGTKLWKVDIFGGDAPSVLLAENLFDGPSRSFFMQDRLYLLTGEQYLTFDGSTVAEVEGYVPTLQINRLPDGSAGDMLEAANLLSPKGIEEFCGNGTKVYHLCRTKLDSSPVECEVFNNETNSWDPKTEGVDFTVDREQGTVTFTQAPVVSDLVNVKITSAKTVEGSADKIRKAKNCVLFNDGTVFVCGSVKGQDFRSGYRRPDYFPEDGFDRVGSDENDIVGYCRLGEYLGIIKEESEQDSTLFLRWQETEKDLLGNQQTVFYKKPGIVGVGTLSPASIGRLVDEPLFLTRRGVYGVTSNSVTDHRSVHNRSTYCNNRLTAEPNLETACTVEWKGRFLVCVNDHCYLLESRRKSNPYGSSNGYVYECYYWENIPAVTFLEVRDDLFFGTADGRICRFNTDRTKLDRFNDDGDPIPVVWSTCMDDDGYPAHLKTLEKRGCVITMKPFVRSSVDICLRTDRDPVAKEVKKGQVDVFDWCQIDFNRFTFDSNDGVRDISVGTQVRNYRRLQFVVRSTAVDEGFGIYQITKTFRVGKIAR